MKFFQNSVLNKHLKAQDCNAIKAAYKEFAAYFHNPEIQQNIREAKEEQFQEGFLRELFVKVLGYTLNPSPAFNLTTEYKNVKDSKKADGAIILPREHAPTVIAVIELKGTETTDLNRIEAQAFGYKNNQPECVYVITSNFEKLRFYIDNAIENIEFNLFTLTEKEFELLWLCLAFVNIEKNLAKRIKDESVSQEDVITKNLYNDYSLFKRELHQNLVVLNPGHDPLTLFKKSQKLLDRFLFLFFAEDRQLLPPNSVRLILDDWRELQVRDVEIALYARFKKYFEYLNTGFKGKRYDVFAYNGGLFKTDELLDGLKIDDELLYRHTLKLSEYDFASEVDVNILGHIFENSLNELDEIKAQLEGKQVDKAKSKRKKDGVFYTPKYITKYIVDNTVGKLCIEKKAELELVEEEYTTDRKRTNKTKQPLFDKLTAYRNWLLQLTICDPACGSGAFLNQALDFLINEHRYIDELQAKLFGDAMVLSDFEKNILENNLFGVDINEESVEIAKLSLWLRTAQPNRKLNDLNNNIKCGNSLIDDPVVAGDKAFNWQQEFPSVFAKGGFDVVIGNPPYVGIQGITWDTRRYYETIYSTAKGRFDLYALFIEKAMQIKKLLGSFSFIVPGKILNNQQFDQARWIMCNHHSVEVLKIDDKVFDEAQVDSVILLNFGEKFPERSTYKAFKLSSDGNELLSHTSMTSILNDKQFTFRLEISTVFDSLIKKIEADTVRIEEIAEVKDGIVAGVIKDILYVDHKINENCRQLYFGKDLTRYFLSEANTWVNYQPTEMMNEEIRRKGEKRTGLWMRDKKIFHREKLLTRFVGKEIVATYDNLEKYYEHTLHSTHIIDKRIDHKFVLCLYNSKLFTFYYQKTNSQGGDIFPQVRISSVEKLPVKLVKKDEQLPFIEKADLMLSLNMELPKLSQKFQRTIQRKFNLEDLPGKLQNWYLLSYKEFINELSKKKVKMSLTEENEWEAFFLQEAKKALDLKAEIDKTDKEIDRMVYKLYGLTEEEIKIVEGN